MSNNKQYDVIVVGAGHAGVECALACSRMGAKILLITHNIDTIGQMSCNPAIGGIGKGHLVKEIDALGGIMAEAADLAGIQFRILNSRKGPAVRATRAQIDRVLYKKVIKNAVEKAENIQLFQQAVDDLIIENNQVIGIITQGQVYFYAKTVVLTVGTFLGGKIHIGDNNYQGGRAGDPPSIPLANRLRALPFRVGRLKTGTPPRIDSRSIDFSKLISQPGDTPIPSFSVWNSDKNVHPEQISCYIAKTNHNTHKIISDNIQKSAMYSGNIEGVGPRYCPSIEDKIVRFKERDSHQIFIEPEGLDTYEVYPNGISTSLPYDVQLKFVRSMEGLEDAHLIRAGYAIEYDYFDPRDLKPTLETKIIRNLFFAGQINGTTGYEEAAAQGILAGINATLLSKDKEPWYPKRSEAYIGVLIDDLITRGTTEPYRMFTSRAEYRLTLREDNADQRLSSIAFSLGLLSNEKWNKYKQKISEINIGQQWLKNSIIHPYTESAEKINKFLPKNLEKEYRACDLLKRPEINIHLLISAVEEQLNISNQAIEQLEISIKYAGYITRQDEDVSKMLGQEEYKLPLDLNYIEISGLSSELAEKLSNVRPTTIGQATRIPGITPAAISLLLVYIKNKKQSANKVLRD